MRYEIFQIDNERECDYSFEAWRYAKDKFNISDYKSIYSGTVIGKRTLDGEILDKIFETFNGEAPDGFKGHSLSVSDVIIFTYDNGNKKAYYCDSIGWEDITYVVRYQDMAKYLRDELDDEREKFFAGKENKYSYIFMICNDLGVAIEGQ